LYLIIFLVFFFLFIYFFGFNLTGYSILEDNLSFENQIIKDTNQSSRINDTQIDVLVENQTFLKEDAIFQQDYFQLMTVPTHLTPFLNSTSFGNRSYDNLTVYNNTVADVDGDPLYLIYDWRLNSTSIAVLNIPCRNSSSNESHIIDYSTNSLNGTFINSELNFTTGHDGFGACEFDGRNDYIQFNYSSVFDILTDFSVEMWINKSGTNETQTIARRWDATSNDRVFMFRLFNNTIELLLSKDGTANEGSYVSAIATKNLTQFRPHHVAFTYNGSTVFLYIDGILNKTNLFSGNLHSAVLPLVIGLNSTGFRFNGSIDHFRIYNRTLTGNEILLHNQSRYDQIHAFETYHFDNWSCAITPNDGNSDGNTLLSNSLNITNLGSSPYNYDINPKNNSWFSVSNFTVAVSSNVTYMHNITFRFWNSSFTNLTNYTLTDGVNQNFTQEFFMSNLSGGQYYYNVTLVTAFNESTTADTFTIGGDNITPLVNITYPWDFKWVVGSIASGTSQIRIIGNVSDSESLIDSCWYRYNNSIINYTLDCSGGSFNQTIDSGDYGWHRVFVYANDSAGNINSDNITYNRVTPEVLAEKKAAILGTKKDTVEEDTETEVVVPPEEILSEQQEFSIDIFGIPLHLIEPIELDYVLGQITDKGIFLDLGNKANLNLLFGDKPLIDIDFTSEEIKGALYRLVNIIMTPYFWLSIFIVILIFFIIIRYIIKDISLGVGSESLNKVHYLLANILYRIYRRGYYKNSLIKYNYFIREIKKFNDYVGKYRLKKEAILKFNQLNNLYLRYVFYLENWRRKEVYELLSLSYERVKLL